EGSGTRAPSHYLRLLVDVGRASALDEAQAQGHKIKNLVGVLGDRTRKLEESTRTLAAGELAPGLAGPVKSVDDLHSSMKDDLAVSTGVGPDGRVVVAVTDRGPGLDPADRERIFLLGYTTKPRGSGIGLAQARKLVRAHGGEIEVASERGEGATFKILLPTSP